MYEFNDLITKLAGEGVVAVVKVKWTMKVKNTSAETDAVVMITISRGSSEIHLLEQTQFL